GLLGGAIHTVAMTGSSGSGAYAQPGTHHPLRAGNLKSYKALSHQHTPEIEQTLREAAGRGGVASQEFSLAFVPVSAPLVRGILANSFIALPGRFDDKAVAALFHDF